MLKFIKGHASSIDGIEVYPIISLLIFTLFFTGLIWYVVRTRRQHVRVLASMPLHDGTDLTTGNPTQP